MSNESGDDVQCCRDDELEMLRSIYLNELEVLYDKGCPLITVQLHPSTADNVDEQYVRMSLILYLPAGYPDAIPDIKIQNPRGLSDEKLQRIVDDLCSKAEERKGSAMLFELIECAKDHLTAGNRPSCQCAICLYGFTEQDVFTKTKCYHYFHSHCLSRYVTHQLGESDTDKPPEHSEDEDRREVFCPVCRVPVTFVVPDDTDFPPPASALDDSFTVTEDLKQLQNKMADLYKKQRDKGGIIDVEAEKKKFLLEISSVPSKTQPSPDAEQTSVQSSTSEEKHSDMNQQKKELILPRNKSSEESQNSTSASKQTTSWYQRDNRRARGLNYTHSRNSGKHNRYQKMKKNYRGFDEEHSRKSLIQELEAENYANTKSVSAVRNEGGKEKAQEDSETQQAVCPEFGTGIDDELSAIGSDTIQTCSASSKVECVQNKCHHSNRIHPGSDYVKRCQNCNCHSDFSKECVSDNDKKCVNVTHESPFDTDVTLPNRRSGDNRQHHRQREGHRQMRTDGSYTKKTQNEENYLKHSGWRANYRGNKQPEELMFKYKQNGNYNKSRQDFNRRFRYNSRSEQYNSDRKEVPRYRDVERSDFGVSIRAEEASLVQNVQDNLDQVTVDDSSNQSSKTYGSYNRRNYCSSRRTNKSQQEHCSYRNKYEDRPRNTINSCMEHHSPHQLQESSVSKNLGGSISSEAYTSDGYPKHPFRQPDVKKSDEANGTSFSPMKGQNSILKVHKTHDDHTAVFDNSSDCNENCKSTVDGVSPEELKRNNLALRNADTNHPVSRPPPGFAKKVVYGLPSVKPPPGFSQS